MHAYYESEAFILKTRICVFHIILYHTRKASDPLIKSEPVISKDTANGDEGEDADGEEKQKKDDKGTFSFHIKRGFSY